ncbi:MAG: hypothetical protein V3V15_00670 [Sphingorhabdus sp.]
MGISLPQDRKKKAVLTAVVVSIIAGVATMFIPASILGSITGVTGLSELVPATAPPLGDKARALIAFGTGALTLAVLTVFLLSKEDGESQTEASPQDDIAQERGAADKPGAALLSVLASRIAQINFPKMPWVKGENEIRDLSDLPSVRHADTHPDAPARRPLLATKDLPVAADAPTTMSAVPSGGIAENAPVVETPVEEVSAGSPATAMPAFEEAVQAATPKPARQEGQAAAAPVEPINAAPADKPSLDEMIGQLESAVTQRKTQLAELEQVAAKIIPQAAETASEEADVAAAADMPEEGPAADRPPLEAVPTSPAEVEGDIDHALNAALETLQRMNAQAR